MHAFSVEESTTKPESCTHYMVESLNLYWKIFVLFRLLITLYKKIRKSQEILGNKDSANPWILSEFIKIWNLICHFFMLWTPLCVSNNVKLTIVSKQVVFDTTVS